MTAHYAPKQMFLRQKEHALMAYNMFYNKPKSKVKKNHVDWR